MNEVLTRRQVPDALFPTDNVWGVPLLNPIFQADFCELPVRTWGSVKRNQVMPGTWHFYTQDYRFEQLWRDPSGIINSRCVAAVEPNFTTSEQMAKAEGLNQIYRKRWLARYWQSFGIKTWVDMNVAPDLLELNLLGVPRSWRAFMTRGYWERTEDTLREWKAACRNHGSEDILFAVYGGGENVRIMCAGMGWIWIPETMDIAKGKYANV